MLTKMTGVLTRVLDDEARLEVGPFEYQVLVPEAVRRQIQLHAGREVTFHVIEYLEGGQNATRLIPRRIGFLHELDLEMFELLCTVEKIGVKKALRAMARPSKEIADAINRQDARWLSTLPGIGATTAEQVVTTLKRKMTKFLMAPTPTLPIPAPAAPAGVVVMDPADGDAADVLPAPKPAGRRKGAKEPEPAPVPDLPDGKLVDDVYQTLMTVGHNPVEARVKLDALLASGKPFKTVEEALLMVYSRG